MSPCSTRAAKADSSPTTMLRMMMKVRSAMCFSRQAMNRWRGVLSVCFMAERRGRWGSADDAELAVGGNLDDGRGFLGGLLVAAGGADIVYGGAYLVADVVEPGGGRLPADVGGGGDDGFGEAVAEMAREGLLGGADADAAVLGNELRRRDPSLAICYLTAEEYLNEYVNYIKDNNVPAFRNKYRSVDVLLLDDVQFLQKGKGTIQEEFFNNFCALQQAKKQIVMTSDVAPKNLPLIEARLISRFEGGMLQEIESPSYETRLAILKKKAEGLNINIPLSAFEFIADNIKSHVRAMEGALGKVSIFLESFPTTNINNDILAHLLKDFIEKEQSLRKLSIEEIQTAVAKKYNVSMAQILSPERTQSIVTPRQLSMYIARKFTTKSLPEIAKLFDKTHATIIHGVRNIEKRLDVETDLRTTLEEILSEFGYKISDRMD